MFKFRNLTLIPLMAILILAQFTSTEFIRKGNASEFDRKVTVLLNVFDSAGKPLPG